MFCDELLLPNTDVLSFDTYRCLFFNDVLLF